MGDGEAGRAIEGAGRQVKVDGRATFVNRALRGRARPVCALIGRTVRRARALSPGTSRHDLAQLTPGASPGSPGTGMVDGTSRRVDGV